MTDKHLCCEAGASCEERMEENEGLGSMLHERGKHALYKKHCGDCGDISVSILHLQCPITLEHIYSTQDVRVRIQRMRCAYVERMLYVNLDEFVLVVMCRT